MGISKQKSCCPLLRMHIHNTTATAIKKAKLKIRPRMSARDTGFTCVEPNTLLPGSVVPPGPMGTVTLSTRKERQGRLVKIPNDMRIRLATVASDFAKFDQCNR